MENGILRLSEQRALRRRKRRLSRITRFSIQFSPVLIIAVVVVCIIGRSMYEELGARADVVDSVRRDRGDAIEGPSLRHPAATAHRDEDLSGSGVSEPKITTQAAVLSRRTRWLHGDVVKLPIRIARGFPLVAAEINGLEGDLILDTGCEKALALNDEYVPMRGGRRTGTGRLLSGQSFVIRRYPLLQSLEIEGVVSLRNVPNVLGQDLSFIKKVGPRFLGLLGFGFFDGYLMKLDYEQRQITCYKDTTDRRRSEDFLNGEVVVNVLEFEIRNCPNIPICETEIGGARCAVCFDTGTYGVIYSDLEMGFNVLAENGLPTDLNVLKRRRFDLDRMPLAPSFEVSARGVRVAPKDFPFTIMSGITEQNVIVLGYSFLRNYKTVWDYAGKKMYILDRQPLSILSHPSIEVPSPTVFELDDLFPPSSDFDFDDLLP